MAEPSGSAAVHQRRVYLVDRTFQIKYTLMLVAAGLGVPAAFGLWIWQAHLVLRVGETGGRGASGGRTGTRDSPKAFVRAYVRRYIAGWLN